MNRHQARTTRVALLAVPLAVSVIDVGAEQRERPDVINISFRSSFNIVEATIPEMQLALADGRVTSRELVLLYMSRIAQYEDLLSSSAGIAAKAGHPTVIVPVGFIPNVPANLPAGFNPRDQPYGVGFTGTACSEPRLIELAYAFEQATRRRVPPFSAP